MSEVVHHFFPRYIDLHNYSPTNAVSKKTYNWATLNQKVFKRLRFQLVEGDINDIVGCSAGAVERVLWFVRQKMSEFQQFKTRQASKKGTGEDKPNGRPKDKKRRSSPSAQRKEGGRR
eukprot:293203_1